MASSEIRATLTLDIKDFTSNLTQAQSQIANFSQSVGNKFSSVGNNLSSVGKSMGEVGKKMQSTGKDIIGALTPISGVAIASVKSFADYDSAIAQLSRTSGLTGKDLEAMKATIAAMSDQLGLSETDVASIASSVAAYGVSGVKDLSEVTKVASQMQVAFEGVSAEDAAASIAKFGNVTGLSMDKANNLGSCIAGLENNSAALATEIMEVNNRIGGMSSSVGMSAADISAWSTTMISGGMSAELAGSNFTKFQGVLSSACSQGSAAVQGFADVAGMSADAFIQLYSTDATGATEAFLQGLNRIEDGGGSVVATLDELGLSGTEQVRMMQVLMAAADGTGKEMSDLQKYMSIANDEFNNGTALQEEFNTQSDTLKFTMQSLKSELSDTGKAIGAALAPAIQDVAKKFTDWLGKVQQFAQEHPKVVQGIAGIVAGAMAFGGVALVVGKFTSAIGGIVSGVGSAISAISGLGGVVGLLTNPITLVIAGIAAFVAAIVYCWNNVDGFKESVSSSFQRIWEVISDVCTSVWNVIQEVWGAISPYVVPMLQSMAETIGTIFTTILDIIVPVVEGVWNTIKTVWGWIGPYVIGIFEGVAQFISGVWKIISTVITTACNIIKAVIHGDWGEIKDIVINAAKNIWDGICSAWEGIKGITVSIFEGVKSFVVNIWENIKSKVSDVVSNIKEAISNKWNEIKTNVSNKVSEIKTDLINKWNEIKSDISNKVSEIKTDLINKWNEIKTSVTNKVTELKTNITNKWNEIRSTISGKAGDILDAIKSPFEDAWDFIQGIPGKISGVFKNMDLSLPHINLPHFKIDGEFSLNPPSIPTISVDWYAKGGFFNSANVIGVGEAGREAVLPLENKRNMKPYAQAVASLMNDFVGGGSGTYNINITQNNTINSELDIKKVSQELARETERECRKRGLTPRTNR